MKRASALSLARHGDKRACAAVYGKVPSKLLSRERSSAADDFEKCSRPAAPSAPPRTGVPATHGLWWRRKAVAHGPHQNSIRSKHTGLLTDGRASIQCCLQETQPYKTSKGTCARHCLLDVLAAAMQHISYNYIKAKRKQSVNRKVLVDALRQYSVKDVW